MTFTDTRLSLGCNPKPARSLERQPFLTHKASDRLIGMGPEPTQSTPPGAPEPQRKPVSAENNDASLSEAVATLRKRLWILILAAVLGTLYGVYKASTQPRLFTAISVVQVHSGSSNAYRLESSYYGDD